MLVPDLLVKTHAGFLGSDYVIKTAAIQTSSSVPQAIFTLPVLSASAYWMDAMVMARNQTECAWYQREVVVHRHNDGLIELHEQNGPMKASLENLPWHTQFAVSGSNVSLMVHGGASTVLWVARIAYQGVLAP